MKCESRRNSPPLGNAHQLVILFQMISPENMHAVNNIWTKIFVFMFIYIKSRKKRGHKFEKVKERMYGSVTGIKEMVLI